MSTELDVPLARAASFWESEHGYAAPKIDVRGGVFAGELSGGRILASQIERPYRHQLEPDLPTDFD